MKKLFALAVVLVTPILATAVDFQPLYSSGLSSPGSIALMAQKLDANFTAAKTAIEAAQTLDADLTDLADGSLTGSKVGTGIAAGNVTTGNLPVAVMTNALAGTAFTTNTLTGDGVTNVFIWSTVGTKKILHSLTTTP